MLRKLGTALLVLIGAFVLIQLVPYGRDHANPPVVQEPAWDSQGTQSMARRACFDCHSNETTWPWYTNVAPASWLVARDVEEGREKLNFSEWNRAFEEADEAGEVVRNGEMPPAQYTLVHRDARLSDTDRELLAAGLERTLGGGSGEREGDDDD